MDGGGKRSATPLFDRRPDRDATEAGRAAESVAAPRGSPQAKNVTAGVALARHFRSHPASAASDAGLTVRGPVIIHQSTAPPNAAPVATITCQSSRGEI
jgi:hypothetical protein